MSVFRKLTDIRGFAKLKIRLNSLIRLILDPQVWMFEKPKIWTCSTRSLSLNLQKKHIYEPILG